MCISLISHCLMKPFCEKRTFFKTLLTRGTPQQALASQFYRKITGLLIELYQLEEEQVAGKRYLTMGFCIS